MVTTVWTRVTSICVCLPHRLCVAALSVNSFCGSREALYGVFDGDRNVEVPYLLQCTMNDVLAEELHKTKSDEDYMTNTFLVMQRYVTDAGRTSGPVHTIKVTGSSATCWKRQMEPIGRNFLHHVNIPRDAFETNPVCKTRPNVLWTIIPRLIYYRYKTQQLNVEHSSPVR